MTQATVRVLFLRQREYAIDWPGARYDIEGAIQDYTAKLSAMAGELGIALDLRDPLYDSEGVAGALAELVECPPDGLLVIPLSQIRKGGTGFLTYDLLQADLPTVIFTPYLWWGRVGEDLSRRQGVQFISTLDISAIRPSLRMIQARQRMRLARVLVVKGDEPPHEMVHPFWGTVVRTVPVTRYVEEFRAAEGSAEATAVADEYLNRAIEIREPSREDVIEAAQAYLAAKRLLQSEGADAISMDCLNVLRTGALHTTPCIANSRLNDEGIPAACERDLDSLLTMMVLMYLFELPSFIGDPTVDTVRNTWINSHCMCPTRLAGIDSPAEPFRLRRYGHLDLGVSPQVLWEEGQPVTLAKYQSPDELVFGSGKVVSNIDSPPSHICINSVEIAMDNLRNAGDVGAYVERLHILTMYENKVPELRAFCQLVGLKATEICDACAKRYEDPVLDKVRIYD